MLDESKIFSVDDIKTLAKEMQELSGRYEVLFANFGKQLFDEIVEISDMSEQLENTYGQIESAWKGFEFWFPSQIQLACSKGVCALLLFSNRSSFAGYH